MLSVGSRRSSLKWVPGSWASNSKCPTAIWDKTVSRHEVMMHDMTSSVHTRDWKAVVHLVPGSLLMKAVMHHLHRPINQGDGNTEPDQIFHIKEPQSQATVIKVPGWLPLWALVQAKHWGWTLGQNFMQICFEVNFSGRHKRVHQCPG